MSKSEQRWPRNKRAHCVGCGILRDERVNDFLDYLPFCEKCLDLYDKWNKDSWIGYELCRVSDCKNMIEDGDTMTCFKHKPEYV